MDNFKSLWILPILPILPLFRSPVDAGPQVHSAGGPGDLGGCVPIENKSLDLEKKSLDAPPDRPIGGCWCKKGSYKLWKDTQTNVRYHGNKYKAASTVTLYTPAVDEIIALEVLQNGEIECHAKM